MESKLEKNKKFLGSVVNKTPNGNQSKAFHGHGGNNLTSLLHKFCLFPCQKRMVSQQTIPHKLSLQ